MKFYYTINVIGGGATINNAQYADDHRIFTQYEGASELRLLKHVPESDTPETIAQYFIAHGHSFSYTRAPRGI